MTDPVTEAANCELVSSPDGSVTEVVVKPDPITCAGIRESAKALAATGGDVQAAIQHIADAPRRGILRELFGAEFLTGQYFLKQMERAEV